MATRILLAKPGLDVHDRGIRMIARACRDAGMEVVLLGVGIVTVAECVTTAIQESVDVIGLSIMTGQPEVFCRDALAELQRQGVSDIPLVVGGVIRDDERDAIASSGVAAVFTAGAPLEQVISTIETLAAQSARTSGANNHG